MSPRSVVVSGANRGIGFGLVQQLLKNKDIEILIATTRNVQNANDLTAIKDPRLHILSLDITKDDSIEEFVKKVDEIVGDHGLNLLVNNAGTQVLHKTPTRKVFNEQMDVNLTSTVLLTQHLLPLLKRAASRVSGSELSSSRAAILNISSLLGSMSHNEFGSYLDALGGQSMLAYRLSKAALNQFTKTLSIDLRQDHILVVSFCPGWVKTDLGGKDAPFTVEQSTSDLANSFASLNASHNGGFFSKTLEPHGW